MATSKLQKAMSKALRAYDNLFDVKENHRPDWLQTDEGARLELDFYIPEIDLAVEVQGKQHYVYVPHFHGDHDGFKRRLEYDRVKREICQRRGINLIEIDTKYEIEDVIDEIARLVQLSCEISGDIEKAEQVKDARQKSLKGNLLYLIKEMRRALNKQFASERQRVHKRAVNLIARHGIEALALISADEQEEFMTSLKLIDRKLKSKRRKYRGKYLTLEEQRKNTGFSHTTRRCQ